jgi:Pyruvate/2-oxoacid:ferredoxin oxidoreductase gamma subunit
VADGEVLSPASPNPHVLLVFNAPSLEKFGPTVRPGGMIIYDRSVIEEVPDLDASVKVTGVPITGMAVELGNLKVKNVVAWGALQAATGLFPGESFMTALENALGKGHKLLPLNEQAFARGAEGYADWSTRSNGKGNGHVD